jgi:glycosyltransferase 2 family protein
VSSSGRWGRVLVGLVVAAAFVSLLAGRVDRVEVERVLAGADWRLLALALLVLTADMGARITRWWLMLRSLEPALPLSACIRPFLSSLAINNTVPLRAGDVVRVFGFRRTLRAPTAHVVGTLLLERLLDLMMLLAILFACLLGTAGVLPRPFLVGAGLAGVAALTALGILTFFPAAVTAALQGLVARLFRGRKWASTASRSVGQLTASVGLLRNPAQAARLLGLTLAAWLLEGAVFACVMWALGINVGLAAAGLSLGAGTLATLIPSSPGYVGTFDYFAALGLTAYGATVVAATAFALLVHLVLWVPVTIVGLALLLVRRTGSVSASLSSQHLSADPL